MFLGLAHPQELVALLQALVLVALLQALVLMGLAYIFWGFPHTQELVALLKQPIRNNKKNKKEETKKA